MTANYSKAPLSVELVKRYNDKVLFKLRKNIVKNSITNEFNSKKIDNWTCDEIEVRVYDKTNIQDEVTSNFNLYYTLGEQQIAEHVELEAKRIETYYLINGGHYNQVSVNQSLVEENQRLTAENEQLKTTSNTMNTDLIAFMDYFFQKFPD